MVSVRIHLRGQVMEERTLPSVPRVGHYISTEGKLWVVDGVVIGAQVSIYCLAVGDALAAELQAAWAGWTNARHPTAGMHHLE